jgi:hypothetical protein
MFAMAFMSQPCLRAYTVSARALLVNTRESPRTLEPGLLAACLAALSALSFPSTPEWPGTHWIMGSRPRAWRSRAMAWAWIARDLALPAYAVTLQLLLASQVKSLLGFPSQLHLICLKHTLFFD